jgi:hypothetical protein
MTYTIQQVAAMLGKSENLLYRRLTEKLKRYEIRYVRKEGGRWVFDKQKVDQAIANGESIIVRIGVDIDKVLHYFSGESRSCGRSS